MKWRKKDCNWECSVHEYFQNMHPRKRKTFYEHITNTEQTPYMSTNEKLENLFLEKINLAKNIQEVNIKIKKANEFRNYGISD